VIRALSLAGKPTTNRECLRRLQGRGPERLDTGLADSPPPSAVGVVIDEETLAGRHMALRAAFARLPSSCQQVMSMLTSDPPCSYAEISTALGFQLTASGRTAPAAWIGCAAIRLSPMTPSPSGLSVLFHSRASLP